MSPPPTGNTCAKSSEFTSRVSQESTGVMSKSKVTLDIMYDKECTSTGKITSAMRGSALANHLFQQGLEHTNMKIQQVVLVYLNDDEISRPPAPPIVSPCKDIMSCFSFMFLGVSRHYARRSFNFWCTTCSRVRGR